MLLKLLFFLFVDLFNHQVAATNIRGDLLERCSACHGTAGLSEDLGTPHLNGQNEQYLLRQIESLQLGRRSLTTQVKRHVPVEANADDLAQLARHYANADPARPVQDVFQDKVRQGEQLFYSRCEACHLDEGRDYAEGKSSYIPRLAGQDLAYLLGQMQMFADGKRPFAALQDDRFQNLGHEHFEQLAHFFASRVAVTKAPQKRRHRH